MATLSYSRGMLEEAVKHHPIHFAHPSLLTNIRDDRKICQYSFRFECTGGSWLDRKKEVLVEG